MASRIDFKTLVDAVFDKKNPKTPPLVEVLWLDAEDISGDWFDNDGIDKSCPAPSVSVGYLLYKDDKAVKVAALINHTHAAHGITIPMGMVKKINYLHR